MFGSLEEGEKKSKMKEQDKRNKLAVIRGLSVAQSEQIQLLWDVRFVEISW